MNITLLLLVSDSLIVDMSLLPRNWLCYRHADAARLPLPRKLVPTSRLCTLCNSSKTWISSLGLSVCDFEFLFGVYFGTVMVGRG